MRNAQRGAAGRRGPLPWVSRGSCGIVFRIQEDAVLGESSRWLNHLEEHNNVQPITK